MPLPPISINPNTGCGCNFHYGEVSLLDVETKDFSQEVVLEESGSDLLYHKFVVDVSGLVHEQSEMFTGLFGFGSGIPGGTTSGMSLATKQQVLWSYLMHPRRLFQFTVGPYTLLTASSVSSRQDVDVNHGPKPLSCKITHVAGFKAFRVSMRIEICRVMCDSGASTTSGYDPDKSSGAGAILSNKWSIRESRGANFYLSRTISGKLRVKHIDYLVDSYRHIVMPPLQREFQREGMDFVRSADGLTMQYEIRDKQRRAAPPPPAVDWDCTHTEGTNVSGVLGDGSVRVKLVGGPGCDKRLLVTAGIRVIQDRTGLARDVWTPFPDDTVSLRNVIIRQLTIVDHTSAEDVEVSIQYQRPLQAAKYFNLVVDKFAQPVELADLGYDPKVWPNPIAFDGSSPIGQFAAYWQSPCRDSFFITENTQLESYQPLSESDQRENTSTVRVFEQENFGAVDPFDSNDGVNQVQTSNVPYLHIEMESKYITDHGVCQLPFSETGQESPTDPSAYLVRIHRPVTQRKFYINAERLNALPSLPSPDVFVDENGIQEALVHEEIIPFPPELMPDGFSKRYRLQAEFTYALSRSPTRDERLRVGSLPWDKTTKDTNAISITQIADPSGEML